MSMRLQPTEFLTYFADGQSWITPSAVAIRLEVCRLGPLYLPSGRLIACDPAYADDRPFAHAFPPGLYPVDVVVAHLHEHERRRWFPWWQKPVTDARIALAAVILQDVMPTRWEPADIVGQPGQDTSSYSVDSANGCFMDRRAAHIIAKADTDLFTLVDCVAENPPDQPMWMDLRFRDTEPLNMIVFSAGWGDGYYASYLGFTEQNTIARVVTDFYVLADSLIEHRANTTISARHHHAGF